ncbi:hypothetical protein Tco_0451874 [Tanacetum coccineum]
MSTIIRRLSHKLFRKLLLFVELDSGDTVSRNVLIRGTPSPVVIVIDDMVAAVGESKRIPAVTTLSNSQPKGGGSRHLGMRLGAAAAIRERLAMRQPWGAIGLCFRHKGAFGFKPPAGCVGFRVTAQGCVGFHSTTTKGVCFGGQPAVRVRLAVLNSHEGAVGSWVDSPKKGVRL